MSEADVCLTPQPPRNEKELTKSIQELVKKPHGVPDEYVMLPHEVPLTYHERPWFSVPFELSTRNWAEWVKLRRPWTWRSWASSASWAFLSRSPLPCCRQRTGSHTHVMPDRRDKVATGSWRRPGPTRSR